MHFLQLAQLLANCEISHMRFPNEVIGQPSNKESIKPISLLIDIKNGQHTAADVADSSLLCWGCICRSVFINWDPQHLLDLRREFFLLFFEMSRLKTCFDLNLASNFGLELLRLLRFPHLFYT